MARKRLTDKDIKEIRDQGSFIQNCRDPYLARSRVQALLDHIGELNKDLAKRSKSQGNS